MRHGQSAIVGDGRRAGKTTPGTTTGRLGPRASVALGIAVMGARSTRATTTATRPISPTDRGDRRARTPLCGRGPRSGRTHRRLTPRDPAALVVVRLPDHRAARLHSLDRWSLSPNSWTRCSIPPSPAKSARPPRSSSTRASCPEPTSPPPWPAAPTSLSSAAPTYYGLMAGGGQGVERTAILLEQIERTTRLLGVTSISEPTHEHVTQLTRFATINQ